jgi:hypothetical protein
MLLDWKRYSEGTILEKGVMNDINYAVIRSTLCICVYVGVPWEDKIASLDYNDIPVNPPGGLTFKSTKNTNFLPQYLCWFGWDYGHDFNINDMSDLYFHSAFHNNENFADIEVKKLKKDIWDVTYDLHNLLENESNIWPKKCSYCGSMNRKSVLMCERCGAPIENDNTIIWDC